MSTLSIEPPRRELDFAGPAPGFRLLLKRNCSISPAGLALVFALLALATLGIGAGFAAFGAWLILPFAGLEVIALGAAFLVNGRHAADYEKIEYAPGRLRVEVGEGERVARHELDPRVARVRREGERVLLQRAPGEGIEVGRHLDAQARSELAAQLERRLQG